MTDDLEQRMRRVEVVLMDVDGVLTDGTLRLDDRGGEARSFFARDGLGIRLGQRGGLIFGIVSGRETKIVSDRAEELYITEVHQRVVDKAVKVDEIVARLGTSHDRLCFIGDDLVDIPPMRRVGLAVAPSDAAPEVAAVAHFVTERPGGRGAVRETIDRILRAKGKWDAVTGRFMNASEEGSPP